jgi:preprotein translocase SecE subunit
VAKKATTAAQKEKPKVVRNLLSTRVDLVKGKRLGRDVKAPRWLRAIGSYFKGSWKELKEVRWPTRRVTWGQTVAVIAFTLVLVVFILALDYGFEQLFKQVIL